MVQRWAQMLLLSGSLAMGAFGCAALGADPRRTCAAGESRYWGDATEHAAPETG